MVKRNSERGEVVTGAVLVVMGLITGTTMLFSGWRAHQDHQDLKQATQQNLQEAKENAKMAGNVAIMASENYKLQKEKAEVEVQYDKKLVEKDKQVGEQFGILTTQAMDIHQTSPSGKTDYHVQTATQFMNLYKGKMADIGLAWNQAYVNAKVVESEKLKFEMELIKKQNEELRSSLLATSSNLTLTSKELETKTIQHIQTAGNVELLRKEMEKDSGFATQITFYAKIIGAVMLVGILGFIWFYVWQLLSHKRQLAEEEERRRQANKEKYEHEKLAYDLKTGIKTFLAVGPEGNEQMSAILGANGLKKHFEDVIDINKNGVDDRIEK